MVLPLNLRIFKLVVGLIGLSTLAILFAQWFSTSEYATKQVVRDLNVAQSVVEQVFESREKLLFSASGVLTQDFGFKAALASRDEGTIESALANHGERIGADLMLALALDGKVIGASIGFDDHDISIASDALIEQVLLKGGASLLLVVGDQIYQAIMLLVEAPDPIAISVVAFEADKALLAQIANITKLDIILSAEAGSGLIVISSLSAEDERKALEQSALKDSALGGLFSDSSNFATTQFEYQQPAYADPVRIVLAGQLGTWFDTFKLLLSETFYIALVSMLIASALGLLLANNLSRPLALLGKRAQQIAAGNYQRFESLNAGSVEINRLEHAFDVMQHDIQEREQEIQYQASHDALTGLINRDSIGAILQQRLNENKPFQLVGIKATGFREVNTAFGMYSGDVCIVSLAKRVSELEGVAARINGSEILWCPTTIIDESRLVEILRKLEEPHMVGETAIQIKLAAGVMHLPQDANSLNQIFSRISASIDIATGEQSRLMAYAPGIEESRLHRFSLLTQLEKVLADDSEELSLVYQPKLSLANSNIETAEALIRWNSKTLGFVPPDDFIPVAEKAGLIELVTRWVVNRAIRDMSRWKEDGVELKVAINLSVHDIANESLMSDIYDALREANLSPEVFEFEITESDLMSDPEEAIRMMQSFRDRGFDLAIDDFGTGYSSLAYLKTMPVSELKIDKSFVLNLVDDSDDRLIVRSIIDLAKRFDLKVVAEGIENEEALELLKSWGCDWGQGYHISRPVDPITLLTWLQENKDTQWFSGAV